MLDICIGEDKAQDFLTSIEECPKAPFDVPQWQTIDLWLDGYVNMFF